MFTFMVIIQLRRRSWIARKVIGFPFSIRFLRRRGKEDPESLQGGNLSFVFLEFSMQTIMFSVIKSLIHQGCGFSLPSVIPPPPPSHRVAWAEDDSAPSTPSTPFDTLNWQHASLPLLWSPGWSFSSSLYYTGSIFIGIIF